MRVFTGSLCTETNTFSPVPTGLAAFRDRGYYPAGTHPPQALFYSGPLGAARQRGAELGWTVIEGMVAGAQPGGPTSRAAYELLRDELLADLQRALPVDMVVLALHGAMVADGYPDCEGDILRRVRSLVGPDVVVGAELDPHCHLSETMVEQADLLILFKEYPHTDVAERALELVDLCAAQVRGEIRPVAGVVDTGMIVPLHTTREPVRGFVDRLQQLEQTPGLLSISVAHGFPWGDVPDMGTKLLVYSDGDAALATAQARRLADELIAMRAQLQPALIDIDTALDQALQQPTGPVVLADGADNPGGGGAGDSTFILARLLERRIAPAALGPLWDPVAVRFAFEAGLGARLTLRVGGKTGPMSGVPIDAVWTVTALAGDLEVEALTGAPIALGDCVCVETQGISVVLTSLRNQALRTDLFSKLGVDLSAQQLVVVKSSQHFHAAFAPIASAVIYVDAPGSVIADYRTLPYVHVQRPRWPLDA
ncbi:M81 family metallopeptidase [Paucibacter sp. JuS9]|uniref:M81 family metallopeptidase n=1 Tax=Paucibacter sp. JuS9 TaxID=3228748 RepID=UPI003757AA8B